MDVEGLAAEFAERARARSDRDLLIETRVDVAILLQHRHFHDQRISVLEAKVAAHDRLVLMLMGAAAVVSAAVSFAASLFFGGA